MRRLFLGCVALLLVVQGCTMTPGRSPEQISREHGSAGYVERDFNDMHPETM